MIFHENRLPADDSHEMSNLIFFLKLEKMSQILSSAAVVIGALRVNSACWEIFGDFWLSAYYFQNQLFKKNLSGKPLQFGNFINRAKALKGKSYEGLSVLYMNHQIIFGFLIN